MTHPADHLAHLIVWTVTFADEEQFHTSDRNAMPRLSSYLARATLCAVVAIAITACAGISGDRARRSVSAERLHALVDSLVAGEPSAWASAADSLGLLDDARTPTLLLDRVRSDDLAVQHRASVALATLPLNRGLDTLAGALHDDDPFVRWTAARAIGARGYRRAVPALHDALNDTASAVRRAAALSLGAIGDTASFRTLAAFRRDPAEEVRAAVALSLGAFGPRAVPVLRAIVEEDGGLVVTAAVEALGTIGHRDAVPVIGVALLDGPLPTRIAATRALGDISGADANTLLVAVATDDPHALVRESAALALGVSAPHELSKLVRHRRQSESDVFVRLAWVSALPRHDADGRDALRLLAESDTSPDVRIAAVRALGGR